MISNDARIISTTSIAVADCECHIRARGIVENCAAAASKITHTLTRSIEVKRAAVYGQRATR